MKTIGKEQIVKSNPQLDGEELAKLLEALEKMPRRKKPGYSLALPGADPRPFNPRPSTLGEDGGFWYA